MRKRQMANVMLEILDTFHLFIYFFGMSSDVLVFKVRVFANFELD